MNLSMLDWGIIFAFFAVTLFIGLYASRGAGKSYSEFFLSGRDMSWWLLGVSMVATTFSADTPNLVTDLVRTHGVAGNWSWWAFLLTGMLTVFVYARLWRRSGVLTDLEFYELRYSGKPAAFLRGFRAIYLGVFFNVMIMATVSLAAIKIGAVMLDLEPVETLLITSIITVIYTSIGGLKGVVLTDFFQFVLAMIGMVVAAVYIVNLPEVGGLSKMLAHPNVAGKLNFLPDFSDSKQLIPLFLMPLAVQWWSVWYPGAEPGGGGYIAQRMLSAKDEKNAVTATLFFNIAHYALRPWPWILIASLQAAFPHLDPKVVKNDLAFSAMLNLLPAGLIGLLIAALLSAFMSTISTHLNWGSSYVVNDFYKRFLRPDAPQNELVNVGRISTVVLMIMAALLALALENALQAFNILLQIGAGTGLIFILRWFWWRINAYSEITAMVVSFMLALYFELGMENPLPEHIKLLAGVGITTLAWVAVTFLTAPSSQDTMLRLFKLIQPSPTGWKPVIEKGIASGELDSNEIIPGKLPNQILGMFLGCALVYAALFASGYWIYGNFVPAIICTLFAAVSGYLMIKNWDKIY